MIKREQPEVLPGADPNSDCQTTPPIEDSLPADTVVHQDDHDDDDDHEHSVTWDAVDNQTGSTLDAWRSPQSGWATVLERLTLAIEKPINRLTGFTELNPFYHTGTIATFLLIIVGLTGIYLFMFFQYGFDASYYAVNRLEEQFIGRTIRALHKYASGALVITTLLHAYRTLFMERFRGPRWLAWVTGMVMTAFLWIAGVTGYWLVWDQRAQLITEEFTRWLNTLTSSATDFQIYLVTAEQTGLSWSILLIILAVHVLLFVTTAVFFWLHIKRLNRPKWIPDVQWVTGMGLVLLVGAIIFPAGMLPQANMSQAPGVVTFDPIFLFFLPFAGTPIATTIWVGLLLFGLLFTAIPWILRRPQKVTASGEKRPFTPPPVNIIKDRCTGCTKCALDCPYGAIQMVERHDGKRHKFIAIEDPKLCVSCGICVGSCDGVAVTMGNTPPEMLWETVSAQLTLARGKVPVEEMTVVFTCERHASHGAKPYLPNSGDDYTAIAEAQHIEVIAVPCAGTLPPDMLTRTLDTGVAGVKVIGCPPDDCVNREGNVWMAARLSRKRVPRLRKPYANAPITAVWLPPNQFEEALQVKPIMEQPEDGGEPQPNYLASRRLYRSFGWKNLLIAFALLAFVLGIQILTTDLPFNPYPNPSAGVRVVITEPAMPYGRYLDETAVANNNLQLRLDIDGETIATYDYDAVVFAPDAEPFFVEQPLESGTYHVNLSIVDDNDDTVMMLFDSTETLAAGETLQLGTSRDMQKRELSPSAPKPPPSS